ncbi:hypothetical protein AVEN_64624-1 [Araneus ventricosus]|uniref:Uncharacterized protein n=1 Tax=Araneus ventricosus TaxID=182803 RepID=A0A4Y2HDN0_ARAVE|nr:hypothetical protein AVEN_64624-1 [Araneus ventricosus]
MRCQIRNWSCQTKAVSRSDIAIPVWGGSVKRRDIRTRVWLWWNWSEFSTCGSRTPGGTGRTSWGTERTSWGTEGPVHGTEGLPKSRGLTSSEAKRRTSSKWDDQLRYGRTNLALRTRLVRGPVGVREDCLGYGKDQLGYAKDQLGVRELKVDIQIPPLRDYPPSIRDRVGGERGGDGPPPGGERRGVINEKWPSLEVCQEATCTRPSSSGRGHRGKERPGIDAFSSKRTSSLESSAPLHRHAILIKPQIEDLKTAVSQAETCAG